MARQRIVNKSPSREENNLPLNESATGHFYIEELDEENNVIESEVEREDLSQHSNGIVVTYNEQVITFRSGKEVIRSGGTKERVFSPQVHGKNWKKIADEFIATCKESNRKNSLSPEDTEYSSDRRPRFVKAEEF